MKTQWLFGSMTLAMLVACSAGGGYSGSEGTIGSGGDSRPRSAGGNGAVDDDAGSESSDAGSASVANAVCTSGKT